MGADKQLIVVFEGTAELGFHWKTILSDYLHKILRKFCGEGLSGQGYNGITGTNIYECGLVMFNPKSSFNAHLMRSGWTKDIDRFIEMLSTVRFSGGSNEGPSTAEGLADVLTMFAIPENECHTEKNQVGKRHCILVTASDPYPWGEPVHTPNIKDSGPPPRLSDAWTVAQWFGKCSVSLSVISPRRLPRIRALYEAGKRNPNSEDPHVHLQNPMFLVLISEDFMEACVALNPIVPPRDSSRSAISVVPNPRASSSAQPGC